jgi:hypothetical protein
LRNRGWAFQEWHLARRIVFFMPAGITWLCKSEKQHEVSFRLRGTIPLLDWSSTWAWLEFLTHFSGAALSIPTDRLVAIQGITNEIQKKWTDLYRLGVFEKQPGMQLIWMPKRNDASQDVSGLPSWSWASLGGMKNFIPTFLGRQRPYYRRLEFPWKF